MNQASGSPGGLTATEGSPSPCWARTGAIRGRAVPAAGTSYGGGLHHLARGRPRVLGQPAVARRPGQARRCRRQPRPSRPLERPRGPVRGSAVLFRPSGRPGLRSPRFTGLMSGEKPDGTFDWRVVGDGDSAVLGPARWTWSVTDHPVEALADGPRSGTGRSVTRPTPAPAGGSVVWGRGQLALVEASLTTEAEGVMQHSPPAKPGRRRRRREPNGSW